MKEDIPDQLLRKTVAGAGYTVESVRAGARNA